MRSHVAAGRRRCPVADAFRDPGPSISRTTGGAMPPQRQRWEIRANAQALMVGRESTARVRPAIALYNE